MASAGKATWSRPPKRGHDTGRARSNDIGGPAGTQRLTITIGTGSSDRLVVTGLGSTGTCSG
jgi:hypothetical protein